MLRGMDDMTESHFSSIFTFLLLCNTCIIFIIRLFLLKKLNEDHETKKKFIQWYNW